MVTKFRVFVVLFLATFSVVAQNSYPTLTEIVTDSAKIFSDKEHISLRQKLTYFERETTNQIVVLTVDNLKGISIFTYGLETFNQNKLGQAEIDNGLLILFAKTEREVRIVVGDGLEPYITDAFAKRIIETVMIPEFKNGEYFKGIDKATDKIIELLSSDEAREEFAQEIEGNDKIPWFVKLFIGLFLSIFVAVGGKLLFDSYSSLIEILRGVLIGKLGFIRSIFMLLGTLYASMFGLVFTLVPLGGFLFILSDFNTSYFKFLTDDLKLTGIVFVSLFFGIALLIAIIKIIIYGKEGFGFSFNKTDLKYYGKTFSSKGTHSFSFSSGSSSSSSSRSSSSGGFSGGGGRSSGGGASGSW
ncbi:TPM domain-containing protein [Aureibaculum sp. 2210JD6-5]|uniref:TPM domain-containing protein n=1 Tax=Aureibaculum sp. 2210JD6-5 TaxID=3103957 RepID=UPI002AAC64EC|nr:TPM domain-containing protein [Aureibaculum sp. 2210JD6-5]MDY7394674.1 TPM domain-containing protein [Aureibaculum sp. 2210JD6-5]